MEIKDVKPNQGNVEVVVDVITKDSPRQFEKFGKKGKVCNAKVRDGSGEIVLTLWNDDVDKVNEGDKIKLQNGWCSEYKGERQLSAGKFGKIEVVGKGAPAIFTNDPAKLQAAQALDEDGDDDGDEDPEEIGEEEEVE